MEEEVRAAALAADPEEGLPRWSSARVGFPKTVIVGGGETVGCPLSALAECFNVRCSAHRAAIPQARRNFEQALVAEVLGPQGPMAAAARHAGGADRRFGHAGAADVARGRLRVTAVGAGLAYQEFRLVSMLRRRGVRLTRLVLIDRLYEFVCSAHEPPNQASLRDGIFDELGSWAGVRSEVAKALQQVTDFLHPDGTEVFVFKSTEDYEALCSEPGETGERWSCDLLMQVDAGELKDGIPDAQKASMLRPGGLFCVLWAMTARTPEEEGLDADEHPLRFCFTRIERRLNDWVARGQSGQGRGKDPRIHLVRQWRTYRSPTQEKLHEVFLQKLEKENQDIIADVKRERPDISEADLKRLESDLRRY